MKRLAFFCLLLAFSIPVFAKFSLHRARQLVVVTTPNWTATTGTLQRYQRAHHSHAWTPVGLPIPIAVGKTGFGWGIGAVPIPASVKRPSDPVKHEGDLRSPAGIFPFGTAFGYAPHPPAPWHLHYLHLVPTTHCVDDTHSRHYNHIVDSTRVPPDWTSSEDMRNSGVYYTWGVVIRQNLPNPIPGRGSCVFMHVWAYPGEPTVGCTAMAEPNLTQVLAWLKPSDHPLLVQMPLPQYRLLRQTLPLPPPPTQ